MGKREKIVGIHAVESAVRNDPERVLEIWIKTGRQDQRVGDIQKLASRSKIPIQTVDAGTFGKQAGSAKHQGILAFYAAADTLNENDLFTLLEKQDGPAMLLVLDGVTDPHNLGACMRTADAAGVSAVIVPKDNAVSINPTVRKVASGAVDSIPFVEVTNLSRVLDKLRQEGFWVVGTSDKATQDLYEIDLKGNLVVVMGAEGKGMRRLTEERCDFLVALPMAGSVSSLNVSVATGVCLFEAVRQRKVA